MKTLVMALLGAAVAVGSTGCCCSHGGCNPCGYGNYGGGCNSCYGYAPSGGCCPSYGAPAYGGGCPNGNCGVGGPGMYPAGAYYGAGDVMTASNGFGGTMTPAPTYAQGNGLIQTAMAPMQSLPTY